MASIYDMPRNDFMAYLPELSAQGLNADDLLRAYNAKNNATAGLQGLLGSPSQSIADSGRERALGGLLSYDPNAGAGMDRVRSIGFEPRAMAQDALSALLGAGQNAYNATAGRLPAEDVPGAAFDAASLVTGLGAASAGRGLLDYDPNTMRAGAGGRMDVPRPSPENSVLSAVDRLSAEDLASAQPFSRSSGYAAPRTGGGRGRDPALFSDFSSKKQTGVAPSDWTVSGRSLPTSVRPPRGMTAEQLQQEGFTDLTGFVADSTMGNTIIDEINGLQLPSPVMQQAGHAFGDNIDDLGFMSEAGALAAKTNAWGRMQDGGGRVAVTPMTMGTSGGDFSQHQAMNLVQAIRAAESQIDPNFVPLVGAAKNNNRLLPEGMGLLSPELPEYLMSLKGGQRAAFVKALDTAPALQAGVPSVGAVRWASTDQNLIDQPTLSSGYRLFEPDLADRDLRDFFIYPENHGSYDAAIKRVGDNMTMGAPRPWMLQFPDEAYDKIMASTPRGSNMPMVKAMPKDLKSFQMNPNLRQQIDNQWVDSNMTYDELIRGRGREQADLYAIDAMMNRATRAGR